MPSSASPLPANVVVKSILVTDLLQQMKKQRDFLKWMSRRYLGMNEEQAAAFATGARLFDELRTELKDGLFDEIQGAPGKEVFTSLGDLEPAAAQIAGDELMNRIRLHQEERRSRAGTVGYTYDGHKECPDYFCSKAAGHDGGHDD